MNLQAEKLKLIHWISEPNDNFIIDKLWKIKDEYSKSKDWWDNFKSHFSGGQ